MANHSYGVSKDKLIAEKGFLKTLTEDDKQLLRTKTLAQLGKLSDPQLERRTLILDYFEKHRQIVGSIEDRELQALILGSLLERRGVNDKIVRKDKKSEGLKEVYVPKWTFNVLAESVLIENKPFFLLSECGSITIESGLELDDRILKPLNNDAYLSRPYSFDSESQVRAYLEKAKTETLDSLYKKVKTVWKKYVDADDFHISICAADTICTYFQDKIGQTHYLFFVGNNGAGKSNNLRILQMLAYRNFMTTDMTPANIYQFLGSLEEGQGTICEDEADNIDENEEKMRIYKNGYTTGFPVVRTDTSNGRMQYKYNTFGFKAFAAERLPDSLKAKGFNQRVIEIQCFNGFPQYDISEVVNPAGEQEFNELLSELVEVRNLLLTYRLLHFHEKLPKVSLNISGRENQLFGPVIRVFQNTQTLKELLPVISKYIGQNREKNANTLHAFLYKTIIDLVKKQNAWELESGLIWDTVVRTLQADIIPHKKSCQTEEFGILSQKQISQALQDVFGAKKGKKNGGNRTLVFDKIKLERLGNIYELSIDVDLAGADRAHGAFRAFAGLDKLVEIGNETSESSSLVESNSPKMVDASPSKLKDLISELTHGGEVNVLSDTIIEYLMTKGRSKKEAEEDLKMLMEQGVICLVGEDLFNLSSSQKGTVIVN